MTSRSDRFPIMDGPSIPWAMIEPWERRALANHDQTLQHLAERGGLSCLEAMCVLEDRKLPRWVPELDADAKQKLAAALAAYDADGLRARIATLEAERLAALKIGYELTLDCQSLSEMATELVRLARVARKQRDALEAERDGLRAALRKVRLGNPDDPVDEDGMHVDAEVVEAINRCIDAALAQPGNT